MTSRDERERVLRGYGEVMCVVQAWEHSQALIWWIVKRKNPSRPTGDFDTARSQKEITRLEAAFHKSTAQEIRVGIAPHLEAGTAKGIEALIPDRTRLAHRFLREQAVNDSGDFQPGTHVQLLETGARFSASLDSLARTVGASP